MKATTDALIIGGGVIGCAIAYELGKMGLTATLLERGNVGQESSSAAAGMLTPQAECNQDDFFFRFCMQARSLYPDYLEELQGVTGQAVEWHQEGLVHVPLSREEAEVLEARFWWQQKAGLNVALLGLEEARQLEPHLQFTSEPALYFPNEAHLDNARFTETLAQAARRIGTQIRTQVEAESLLARRGKILGVRTAAGDLHAGVVINAAGAWAGRFSPAPDAGLPVTPVRGQMLALKIETPLVKRLVYSKKCYLVPRENGELLVGATAEWVGFDKRNTAEAVQKLLDGAIELVPELKAAAFLRSWAGLRPGTPDSLPILGKDPVWDGLIHATGHFRNGILLSALTGKLIAQLVAQNQTSFSLDEFSPFRFRSSVKSPI